MPIDTRRECHLATGVPPSTLSCDADRPPLRHRDPPDAPRCARRWRAPRSATTSTARTRRSTRSRSGPPSCSARRRRSSCRRGRWRNQIALAVHPAGRRGLLGDAARTALYEAGGAAALCGGADRAVCTARAAALDADELLGRRAEDPATIHRPRPAASASRTRTTRRGRARLEPRSGARDRGRAHAARAARAPRRRAPAGTPRSRCGCRRPSWAPASTRVAFCFSKGPRRAGRLGARRPARRDRARAPAPQDARRRHAPGRRARRRRPHALDHNLERLADDHARARRSPTALTDCPRVRSIPRRVETNIVLGAAARAATPARRSSTTSAAAGVLCSTLDRRTLRFVTHLDVDDEAAGEGGGRSPPAW